ncbi:MAG: hypothetical protein OK452_00860 [Thaumarchaeota archaeon]|nr:hypothetical protein [Nitrososphaerota archaeon]
MGKLSRIARALISAVFSILTILFLYGYLKPIGLDPQAILGFDTSSIFQIYGGTSAAGSPFAALVPGGATGLVLYEVLSRVGRSASSVMSVATMPSPDEMMSKMNFPGMMGMMPGMGGMGAQASIPSTLPADISRSQFIVLRCYRQGMKNSADIGRALSMDKDAIEAETSSLTSSGYLTKDRKLTTKALEVLGA